MTRRTPNGDARPDVMLANLGTGGRSYMVIPPLGMLYTAAALESHGYEVCLVDCHAADIDAHGLAQRVRETRPRIVAVGLFTSGLHLFNTQYRPQLEQALREGACEHLVVGGHHVNYEPEIVQRLGLELGLHGDGVLSMPALADVLLRGRGALRDVPGALYRDERGAFRMNPIAVEPDFGAFPRPARHLLDRDLYFHPLSRGSDTAALVTQIGCSYRCLYCSGQELEYNRKVRRRSVSDVADEVQDCLDQGYGFIEFSDDTFTLSRSRTAALAEEFVARGLDFRWSVQTRGDLVDRATLGAMARAGCVKVAFGFGAGDEELRLGLINKRVSNERFEETIVWARELGLITVFNAIVGFPGETLRSMEETYRRVALCDPDFANFHPLEVRPGSGYWRMLLEQGAVEEDFFARLAQTGVVDVLGNDRGITTAEIMRRAARMTLRYYLSPRRGVRAARILRGPVMRHVAGNTLSLFVVKRWTRGGSAPLRKTP